MTGPLDSPRRPLRLATDHRGVLYCAAAALLYSTSSICMRAGTQGDVDVAWAGCNKESLTALVLLPWLVWEACRGRPVLPSWRVLGVWILVGLATQLIGTLSVLWAYGVLGLAVTNSVVFIAAPVSSALLGRWVLGDPVSRRTVYAMLFSAAAIIALGYGAALADPAKGPSGAAHSPPIVFLAVAAVAAAGVTYAALGITIRGTVHGANRGEVMMFIVTGMAALALGPLALTRMETASWFDAPPQVLIFVYAGGLANLLGFICITKGLQLTTVVHANVINCAQVAAGALAGLALFGEVLTGWLLAGVALTIAGVLFIDRPEPPQG